MDCPSRWPLRFAAPAACCSSYGPSWSPLGATLYMSPQIEAKLGYEVVASTGRPETAGYLKSLGARDTVPRAELARAAKPLEKETWAACVDSVGSTTLATVLAQLKYNGIVAACGLAGGADLPGTVMPFLLRNADLQGIDSVMAPRPLAASAF